MRESQRVEPGWKRCRLLPLSWLGSGYLAESIRGPKFQKLRNSRRAVPLKMVIRVRVHQHASLHDLIAEIDPTAQFGCAINDCLVPSHRLRFDLFPVAEPADVGPVRRDRVRTAHPHWLGVVFALGLLALTIAMFLGLGELFPMGFEYGASTEYLPLEVDKEPKEIRAQCLASLRKTSVKNRSIVQKKAKLIKGTAIFVAAALLCYAVAVGLLFFSLLTPQVSVRTFQGLTAQIMFSVTLQPYS